MREKSQNVDLNRESMGERTRCVRRGTIGTSSVYPLLGGRWRVGMSSIATKQSSSGFYPMFGYRHEIQTDDDHVPGGYRVCIFAPGACVYPGLILILSFGCLIFRSPSKFVRYLGVWMPVCAFVAIFANTRFRCLGKYISNVMFYPSTRAWLVSPGMIRLIVRCE